MTSAIKSTSKSKLWSDIADESDSDDCPQYLLQTKGSPQTAQKHGDSEIETTDSERSARQASSAMSSPVIAEISWADMVDEPDSDDEVDAKDSEPVSAEEQGASSAAPQKSWASMVAANAKDEWTVVSKKPQATVKGKEEVNTSGANKSSKGYDAGNSRQPAAKGRTGRQHIGNSRQMDNRANDKRQNAPDSAGGRVRQNVPDSAAGRVRDTKVASTSTSPEGSQLKAAAPWRKSTAEK